MNSLRTEVIRDGRGGVVEVRCLYDASNHHAHCVVWGALRATRGDSGLTIVDGMLIYSYVGKRVIFTGDSDAFAIMKKNILRRCASQTMISNGFTEGVAITFM